MYQSPGANSIWSYSCQLWKPSEPICFVLSALDRRAGNWTYFRTAMVKVVMGHILVVFLGEVSTLYPLQKWLPWIIVAFRQWVSDCFANGCDQLLEKRRISDSTLGLLIYISVLSIPMWFWRKLGISSASLFYMWSDCAASMLSIQGWTWVRVTSGLVPWRSQKLKVARSTSWPSAARRSTTNRKLHIREPEGGPTIVSPL